MKRMLCVLAFFLCFISVLSVSAAQNVVSLHAAYTFETPVSEGYPDVELELTNGKYGTPVANGDTDYYYRSEEFVGLQNSAASDGVHVIVLDLGESYKDLTTFEISALTEIDPGIRTPKKVAFSVSSTQDGEFTPVGEATHTDSDETTNVNILSVVTDEPAEGRYVRCEITPADNAAWTFIDEISVLQGRSSVEEPSEDSSEFSEDASSIDVSSMDASSMDASSIDASSMDASSEDMFSGIGDISVESSSTPDSSAESSTPATGDSGMFVFFLLSAASVLGVAALLGRRRRL